MCGRPGVRSRPPAGVHHRLRRLGPERGYFVIPGLSERQHEDPTMKKVFRSAIIVTLVSRY